MTAFISEVFPGITRIAESYQGILLDAYGVFWGGNDCGLLPDSKLAMEKLVASGKIVGILSNSTQLAAKEVHKLKMHDLVQGKHFHFLMTSGEIARSLFLNENLPFETPTKMFWVFGGVHPKYSSYEAIFQDTLYQETLDIEEADFIYISVPHMDGEDQTNPELFREEVEKLKPLNLPMVCPNPDLFAHEGKPSKAVVRQGSIARIYEEIGGKVFYIGKPHQKAFAMAMSQFEKMAVRTPSDIIMVGDTPETDIRGARLFGMSSALITQNGIMSDRIAHSDFETALRNLDPQDFPDYLIERLSDDLIELD